MTAVERPSSPIVLMSEKQAESPSSRFTAVNNVNGRDSTSHPPSNGTSTREPEAERFHGQPRIPMPNQEKLTISTQTAPRSEQTSENNTATPAQRSPGAEQPSQDFSHKRKRSGSQELSQGVGLPPTNHGLPISKDVHSPNGSPRSPAASREASIMMTPSSALHGAYAKPQLPSYSFPPQENQEAATAQWYARQSQEHAANMQDPTEERLRMALANERQAGNEPQATYGTSPNEDSYQEGYDNRTLNQAQQDDRKKRKRNFSNRTKTGCMTCRKRKKKCDETRPECNNCIRGGFMCTGYPSRGPWSKPGPGEPKQAPIPLQPNGGPSAPAGYHLGASPFPIPLPPPPANREPLPAYRGQQPPPRVDTHQLPSHIGLDERMSATTLPSANSPDSRLSSISYSQASSFPTPVSGHPVSFGNQAQQDFLKGLNRRPPHFGDDQEINTPVSAHPQTLPHINILNPPQSTSHPLQHTTSAQDAARLALSHPASRMQTQKQLMLDGSLFYPFDKELVLERERCSAACWRFNTSTNPNNGVSPEERHRQFRDILQPREGISISPTERSPVSVAGHVGVDVVVEAPFTCDYGYNIRIGNQVAIGKNCTILDTCEVRIGDRTVLGPNVNIYTEKLSPDPKKRAGSKSPHLGDKIIIEEDCWIGGNVTILPGIIIRRGSTIGAGSVVNRNVPESVLVAGNPARVIRGIASIS